MAIGGWNLVRFSIVSVTYKDAWALTKTARSVFTQSCKDYEYVIVDGASKDGVEGLADFWSAAGLLERATFEPDNGVYDAMNKALKQTVGDYVCFMNAGDVFAHNDVLARVQAFLAEHECDGCMGWGELNGRIWASWAETEAFQLSSLGFCHQALFVKRSLLEQCLFDDRPHKTDSDTLQLGRLYESGANIPIVPEVWAVRGGEPGISADLERSQASILETLVTEYPALTPADAETIVAFRRRCEHPEAIEQMLRTAVAPLREAIGYMVLDTLFQCQSRQLPDATLASLYSSATAALESGLGARAADDVQRLVAAQERRAELLDQGAQSKAELTAKIVEFRRQEDARIKNVQAANAAARAQKRSDFVVALTSFPARIPTLVFMMRSILEQTVEPSEVHLFLGRDEVRNENWLPGELRALQERGLVLRFVDKTCHQYDKILHAGDLNDDRPYIIVDDDVIYPPHALEVILEGHERYPNAVIGNRCHWMDVEPNGDVGPYDNWIRQSRTEAPSMRLMPTGAGGVLYPPGFLSDPLARDVSQIMAVAPYADDVWLKTLALSRGMPTFATKLSHESDWYHRYTPTMMHGTLMATNVNAGLNDIQVQRCVAWLDTNYPGWRQQFVQGDLELVS